MQRDNSSQEKKWSHQLFKCVKQIDEPDFTIIDDTGIHLCFKKILCYSKCSPVVHTIALHLDMTQLDLTQSVPCCSHTDLIKYHRLGLTIEEIMEVAMKLSSLRCLGLNLKIEGIVVDNVPICSIC